MKMVSANHTGVYAMAQQKDFTEEIGSVVSIDFSQFRYPKLVLGICGAILFANGQVPRREGSHTIIFLWDEESDVETINDALNLIEDNGGKISFH